MYDLRRLPAAATRGFVAVAGLATLAAALVHAATFGPAEWSAAVGMWPLLFFLVFPITGVAIVVPALARAPFDVLFAGIPVAVKAAGVLGILYVALNFVLTTKALGAAPDQPMLTARLFTGHAMYFFAFATVIGFQLERLRAGKIDIRRGPRDEALERRPLPGPLSRSVTLETMLSPAECASRLLQPAAGRSFTFLGLDTLRGEATAEGFRLELSGSRSPMVYAVGRFEGDRPTFIRVLLTFKRWMLITFVVMVAGFPLFAALMAFAGFPFAWAGIAFVVVFAVGGNFAVGLGQMRRLLARIQRATESEQVSIG